MTRTQPRVFLLAILGLVFGSGLGAAANWIIAATPSAERGAVLTLALFGVAGLVLAVAWIAARGWRMDLDGAAFGLVAIALVLLVASWFTAEWRSIVYHADTLIWSESPFVNDIIRFRSGFPLYGPPADLSSFNYTPGAQLLSWLIASVAGQGDSVAALRLVQVLYVVVAVVVGARTASRLRRLAGADEMAHPWPLLWMPLLFLAATNDLTNPFTHLLHNDALAVLVCAVGFWLLVEHAVAPRGAWLVAMAVLPAAGFLVKQSLAIWCVLFGAWLLLFDRGHRWQRAVLVGGTGLALSAALYWGGLALWGDNFRYWVIEGLGKHPVSPLRSIEHAFDGWAYWAAGCWGLWILARGERARAVFGVWLVWALLFAVETYTSGIAYMLNHMGPGSLLGAVWLAAALPSVWPSARDDRGPWGWIRAAAFAATAVLFVSGLRGVKVPVPSLPADADRYAAAIEHEFEGLRPASVLLDHGSWPYLAGRIVQHDRSAPAGEAGFTQTADFTGLMERLRTHAYARILMRDVDGPEFMYDYATWPVSSGVRDSLLTWYQVVRTIPGVRGGPDTPWLRAISVLEPRPAPPGR